MKLVYEYPGVGRRFPYLVFEEGAERYYKVLLRNRVHLREPRREADRA